MKHSIQFVTALVLLTPQFDHAAETITYSYDANGRLVKVVHAGTVNNGVQTTYSHDRADNRTQVKTVGAP